MDPFAHALFVVRAGRRPRFLAKRELFETPLVGTALRGSRQIPVIRGTGDQVALEEAQQAVDAGEVVVIYPEGTSVTTNPDFSPGPGKTGAVRLALMTGVPIVPVATWGGQYVWRRSGRQSLAFGRPIWVRAGEPFDAVGRAGGSGGGSPRALTDALMGELAAMVADLRARFPRRWSEPRPRSTR